MPDKHTTNLLIQPDFIREQYDYHIASKHTIGYIKHIKKKRLTHYGVPEMLPSNASPTSPTCSQCKSFDLGVCLTKAAADWGNASQVSANRPACPFCELAPF